MSFGWINLFGAVIVGILLVPNILYALREKDREPVRVNRALVLAEQTGRYACVILMWLPLLVWKFGFRSPGEMLAYLCGNGVLLAAYLIVFAGYFRKKTAKKAMALAVLPVCIFLLSGLLLRHWLLAGAAVLFAAGHLPITKKSLEAA